MMRDYDRPFELLKLIRDGVITHEFLFGLIPDSRFSFFASRFIKALAELGFVERSERGDLKPTKRLSDLLEGLDLSLTQLADFTTDSVICSPAFGRPSEPAVKSDVFVLMPFADEFRPVYDDHIKSVAEDLSLTVARADDFFTADSIVSDIWNAICDSNVVIADCTGRNPNVFYEIGIAHTLGKRVVLTAQSSDDIPFDIRHIRVIIYDFTPRGMRDFEKELKSTLEFETSYPATLTEWFDRNPEEVKSILEHVKGINKDG